MKKSLFKRAFAAAAAVPIALTQCLAFSSAAEANVTIPAAVVYAAEGKTVTLENITYIAPSATVSNWNETFYQLLMDKVDDEDTTGTFDITGITNKALQKAGAYKEIATYAMNQITKNPVTYEIQDNGDIVISGTISDLTEAFMEDCEYSLGRFKKQMIEKYGELAEDVDFSGVVIEGTFTVTLKTSLLRTGTDIPIEVRFQADNKEFGIEGLIDYLNGKTEDYRQLGYTQLTKLKTEIIDDAQEKVNKAKTDIADAQAKIDKARDDMAQAQADLDEAKANGTDTSSAQADLDKAKAELAENQAKLDDAKTKLADAQAQIDDANVKLVNAKDDVDAAVENYKDMFKRLVSKYYDFKQKPTKDKTFANISGAIADFNDYLKEHGHADRQDRKSVV